MAKEQVTKKLLGNNSGFTLMEVMIAIAIFTVFASVFVTGFGYNMLDSGKIKEDILLKDLCENKINDIITTPPALSESLTLTKETKDIEGNSNYQSIVEFKKFFVPEMGKIAGNAPEAEEGEGAPEQDAQKAQLEKRVFAVFKENMEKIIWQLEVTIKNKTTGETFKLDTWLYNHNADVKIGTI